MTSVVADLQSDASGYALGWSEAEQDRLIRQSMLVASSTERLFREAGISAGQRVLDIGAGPGDVSLLAATLVGSTGAVVGIERDAGYVARARERVAAVGFRNVSFIQSDVTGLVSELAGELSRTGPFDAIVGRSVLMFLPDPGALLRSLARLLVPGGVVAFHEPAWSPTLAVSARVPLWSRLETTIRDILARSGANTEMGFDLCGYFQEAGLPAPRMHLDMELATDSSLGELKTDLLRALCPAAEQYHLNVAELGDLETVPERIYAELSAARSPIGYGAMVGAWARKTG